MKDLLVGLAVAMTLVALVMFGMVCVLASGGRCGDYIGPGATTGWIGDCAKHKSLAECAVDAERMECTK